VQDACLPVGSFRAGQRGALAGPPLAGQLAQPLAQRRRCGDQDRGQRGAGSLAGLNGVVRAGHQQPQRFPVAVGAHLGRVRPGEELTGGADGVDRIALARPALAGVMAGVNLADLLTLADQVTGQT